MAAAVVAAAAVDGAVAVVVVVVVVAIGCSSPGELGAPPAAPALLTEAAAEIRRQNVQKSLLSSHFQNYILIVF